MMQGCLVILEQYAFSGNGTPMCLYGDPAYPLRVHLQSPFTNARLTGDIQRVNGCSKGFCGMDFWRDHQLLQVLRFQEKSENEVELCGEDVCCMCYFTKCHHLPVWQSNLTFF